MSGVDVVSGERVSLTQFEGKPVVITIWASWCPGCVAEAEELGEFARSHPEAAFVGVDFQDSQDAARAFQERYAGFGAMFIALGAGAALVGDALTANRRALEIAAGIFVPPLGVRVANPVAARRSASASSAAAPPTSTPRASTPFTIAFRSRFTTIDAGGTLLGRLPSRPVPA